MAITETKPYRVLSGKHHTAEGVFVPGDVVELTEKEYEAFQNKFVPVAESGRPLVTPQDPKLALVQAVATGQLTAEEALRRLAGAPAPFDVASANVEAVLEAVKEGQLSAADALAQEKARPNPRKTLVEALETLDAS